MHCTGMGLDAESPIAIRALRQLAAAEENCRRCTLYRDATRAVPGDGPRPAAFMLVGEQPGDKEDLAGKPFVGPAGRVLDQALQEAGIAREETFVSNAVKHFKHEMRGKRRLHRRPNIYEIERCKIWLEVERSLVKPGSCPRRRQAVAVAPRQLDGGFWPRPGAVLATPAWVRAAPIRCMRLMSSIAAPGDSTMRLAG
jgi:Uracil DNA glycosylase superfamily